MNVNVWIKILILLALAQIVTVLLKRGVNIYIRKQSKKVNADPTNFTFLKNSVSFIIYTSVIISIFYIIPQLKALGTALFASAGVFAAIIGFASQKAFSNIISGIFILIFKPFKVKDVIEIDALKRGVVEEITLRHTIIRNYENRRIIIPNSIISEETIVNSNIIDEKIKKFVEFDISYESDITLAKKIIEEEALKHNLCLDNRSEDEKKNNEPQVIVRVIKLGEFSVTLRAYVWAKCHYDSFIISCDLNESVKLRFDNFGISIPYPHRTIINK